MCEALRCLVVESLGSYKPNNFVDFTGESCLKQEQTNKRAAENSTEQSISITTSDDDSHLWECSLKYLFQTRTHEADVLFTLTD